MRKILVTLSALLLVGALVVPLLHAQGYSNAVANAALNKTVTLTSASLSTFRLIYSKITLTPTTTQLVSAGGTVTALRGEVNQTTGKTLTDGFFYGAQGKSVINGTMVEGSALRVTGVLGQTDVTNGTITSGQLSAVWADLQGGATITSPETYVLRVSNSASATVPAYALFVGHATVAFAISDLGTGTMNPNTSSSSSGACAQSGGIVAAKALPVTVNGTAYWIPLCTAL